MAIAEFISTIPDRDRRTILALVVVSGLANALLVVAVNEVTQHVALGERPRAMALFGFLFAFVVFYAANRWALLRANVVVERRLKNLRLELMDSVRRSELPVVERMGRGTLYNLVAQETNHLSVALPLVVDAAQQAILLAGAVIYLTYLSPLATLGFVLALAVGYAGSRALNKDFRLVTATITRHNARMLSAIDDVVSGRKEIRLNTAKARDVGRHYRRLSRESARLTVASGEAWASLLLLSSMITYLVLCIAVLVFPEEVPGFRAYVFQVVPVLLLAMGAVSKIAAEAPLFIRADVGLRTILDLSKSLADPDAMTPQDARTQASTYQNFSTIGLRRATFDYRGPSGERTFTVGPLDLEVARGQLVFLVGGNGSGKSTILKILTGLYRPDTGAITVDGAPLAHADLGGYRELFSAIFVDFHVFDRLYGLEDVDPARVDALLTDLGLAEKVTFRDGAFSQTALSTGQRKRMALLAALLEEREVYVFDEWSAEQDVHFRQRFYEDILPDLKARGKTVIAVTHDERFWHRADRVIKLDLGRVEWERGGEQVNVE